MRSFGIQSKTKREFHIGATQRQVHHYTETGKSQVHNCLCPSNIAHLVFASFQVKSTHTNTAHTRTLVHISFKFHNQSRWHQLYGRMERTIMREQEETSRTSLPSLFVYSPSIHQPPHHFSINSISFIIIQTTFNDIRIN